MTRAQTFIVVMTLLFLAVLRSADAAPLPVPKPIVEVDDLTALVLHEARGESFSGMLAVAGVALDRVLDPRWPDVLEEVIYQPYQFSFMHRGRRRVLVSSPLLARAEMAGSLARKGVRECGREGIAPLLWFHATYVDRPASWPSHIVPICTIGMHTFYADKRGARADG